MDKTLSEIDFSHDADHVKTIRVGIVGAGKSTGLVSSLQEGFAGANVKIEVFGPELSGLWKRLSSIDVLQVTAWNASLYWGKAVLAAKFAGKPVVRFWVGSDVLALMNSSRERRFAKAMDHLTTANVVQWHNLKTELESFGIQSRVIPGPHARSDAEVLKQLPRRFTILAYLDDVRWTFYGGDIVLRLAKEHPEWLFLILDCSGTGQAPLENVTYLGHVPDSEIESVYEKTSVLVRVTSHDGLPRMILEALARGRHVVWNQEFPHCRLANSFEEVTSALDSLQGEGPNGHGSKFIRDEYHPKVLSQKWHDFYESL